MGVSVNSSAPVASDAEQSRSNQMIQEQWRMRCGRGGGRSACEKPAGAGASEGISIAGAAGGSAASGSAHVNLCPTAMPVRSTGCILQAHLPRSTCWQLESGECVAGDCLACVWQQLCVVSDFCELLVAAHCEQSPLVMVQLMQRAGGGRMSAMAAATVRLQRVENDGRRAAPSITVFSRIGG